MNAGQRDELVLVAHRAQLLLELGDSRVVEVLLPVERRRAVVRKHLARVDLVHRIGELLGKGQVGRAGFAPHQVGVMRVCNGAADGLVHPLASPVEAFSRAFAGDEGLVVLVVVAGDEVRCLSVGACDHQGRRAANVGRHTCSDQFLNRLDRRHQHLAAHVATLLDRCELVFKVNAARARLDHRLHQFECVEHAAEAGFCIGHDRREVVDVALVAGVRTLGPLDFIGALERVVDALDHRRHRVDRVQRLVRVHRCVAVVVGGHLPARQVDRLDAGFHLLHRLAAGECAEAVDVSLGVDQVPQLLGTAASQCVFDRHRAAQTHDIGSAVAALDALPARVSRPVFF